MTTAQTCDECGYSGPERLADAYPGEDCPMCGGEMGLPKLTAATSTLSESYEERVGWNRPTLDRPQSRMHTEN